MTSPDKPEESVTAKPAGGEAANAPLRIDIAGVALRNSRLTWRDQAAGEVVELADLDFTSGRLFGDVAKRSFELEKLTLATQGKTGNELFELSLDLPSLKISAESLLGKSLNLLARLQGEKRQLEGRGALAGINGSLKNLLVEQVSLNLAARQGDLALTANLTSPLSYEASGRRLVLEKILGGLDVASPALPMKQVKLLLTGQLAADLAKQTATLSIDTKLDDSNIALKLAVNPFSPLILGFGLDIDRLRAASSGRDNTNGGENRPESGQQRYGRGED